MNDEMMREFLRMVSEKLKEPDVGLARIPTDCGVTTKDILLDFKLFVNELYEGKAEEEDGDSLVISLDNGQRFRISVSETQSKLLDN